MKAILEEYDEEYIEQYSVDQLVAFATDLLVKEQACDVFQVCEQDIQAFCELVGANYNVIPYHNFRHAFNVMSTVHSMIRGINQHYPQNMLKRTQFMGLLIAALCHDIRHDGRTSMFHVHSESKMACKYGGFNSGACNVLERMHVDVTLSTIEQCRLLRNFTKLQADSFLDYIRSLILATDMACHKQVLCEFAQLFQKSDNRGLFSIEDNTTVAKMILHCADISNPTKNINVAVWWSRSVTREFMDQVQEENQTGLPESTFMKAQENTPEEAKMHLGFIDINVFPAWNIIASTFPCQYLKNCVANIQTSQKFWCANIFYANQSNLPIISKSDWYNVNSNTFEHEGLTFMDITKQCEIPIGF